VRGLTLELAWRGGRDQPERALRCWLRERLGGGGTRVRRSGMVAVARQWLMALWRFLETGVLPEGAARTEA
jgi:transposase